MPVRKYRSVEEMAESRGYAADDPALLEAIRALWEASRRLAPRSFPAGVYQHRSIEELNAQTERWRRSGRAQ